MFKDMYGKNRVKINLHTHSTQSDGSRTPDEVAAIYRAAGYDGIAITDHWKFSEEREIDGFKIYSGCEYDFGIDTLTEGVYHIVALFCRRNPGVDYTDTPATCVKKIIAADGIPVLGHPAWSLNLPEEAAKLDLIEFTEIHNTVSGVHDSNRPYSGAFVDQMACRGKLYGLLASDDTHYYDGDETVAATMVECDSAERDDVVAALKAGKFYATTGPEVHIRLENGETVVNCSPAVKIDIMSNAAFCRGRHKLGENLTENRVRLHAIDKYVRAEVTDSEGRVGYTNFVISDREIKPN